MATFKGFESFDVYANTDFVFIEQMSVEFGKEVVVRIPIDLWEKFVKAAELEVKFAFENLED